VSIFSDISGIFGGGGSSSASVSSTVNLNVAGLDNMKETVTLAGGVKVTEDVTLHPVTINENLNVQPLTINENLNVQPLTVTEIVDLKPVTLNENIDLKPVAIDSCQTLKFAPFPETRICQPYRHHVALTMFGVELMGVSYDGESKQLIDSPHRPQVVDRVRNEHRQKERPTEALGGRGIRVRILDPDDE
jgi:hypothetical protein